MDRLLLEKFKEAVKDTSNRTVETVESVHNKLLWKIYNARCNEFLLTVNKLSCIKKNKAVDTDMGLRDKLKVYAVEKKSIFT